MLVHLSDLLHLGQRMLSRLLLKPDRLGHTVLCWLPHSSADSEGLGSRAHALVQPFVQLRLAQIDNGSSLGDDQQRDSALCFGPPSSWNHAISDRWWRFLLPKPGLDLSVGESDAGVGMV